MKQIKTLSAVLLVLTMIFTLSATAFAEKFEDEKFSIDIPEGYTYTAEGNNQGWAVADGSNIAINVESNTDKANILNFSDAELKSLENYMTSSVTTSYQAQGVNAVISETTVKKSKLNGYDVAQIDLTVSCNVSTITINMVQRAYVITGKKYMYTIALTEVVGSSIGMDQLEQIAATLDIKDDVYTSITLFGDFTIWQVAIGVAVVLFVAIIISLIVNALKRKKKVTYNPVTMPTYNTYNPPSATGFNNPQYPQAPAVPTPATPPVYPKPSAPQPSFSSADAANQASMYSSAPSMSISASASTSNDDQPSRSARTFAAASHHSRPSDPKHRNRTLPNAVLSDNTENTSSDNADDSVK